MDFLTRLIEGALNLLQQAWENKWLIYILIGLILLGLFLFFNKPLLAPVDIFN